MLIVFVWSVRPALQSAWGIGLVTVCVHALVDYPFARLGVCGWYFVLLGMLSVWRPGEGRKRRREPAGREAARVCADEGAREIFVGMPHR